MARKKRVDMTTAIATVPEAFSVRLLRKDVLLAAQRCSRIVPKKTSMPVLGSVLMRAEGNGLNFYATDLDVCVHTWVPVDGVGARAAGAVCVNAAQLVEALKGTDDVVTMSISDSGRLHVATDSSDAELYTTSAEEFPRTPSESVDCGASFDRAALSVALERTMPFVSADETRYVLNGVYYEPTKGCWTSTDGHRLGHVHMPGTKFKSALNYIIPYRGMVEIGRMAKDKASEDIHIGFRSTDKHHADDITVHWAVVRSGNTALVMRCIDGRFPDYTQVIPTAHERSVVVDRAELVAALKRMPKSSKVGKKVRHATCRMDITENGIALSVDDGDNGLRSAQVKAALTGEPLRISFAVPYILEAAQNFTGPTLHLAFTDDVGPVRIRGVHNGEPDDDVQHIVMPCRK